MAVGRAHLGMRLGCEDASAEDVESGARVRGDSGGAVEQVCAEQARDVVVERHATCASHAARSASLEPKCSAC